MTKDHPIPKEAPEAKPAGAKDAATAKDQLQELTEQLQRLQAEFDNYRKRVDAQAANAIEIGKEHTIKDLLPLADALELAMAHANDPNGKEALVSGIMAIHSQLQHVLEHWGVTEVPHDGVVDPRVHEVYLTETVTDKPAGTILQTLQKGYTRNGTILRTAKVKASRAN